MCRQDRYPPRPETLTAAAAPPPGRPPGPGRPRACRPARRRARASTTARRPGRHGAAPTAVGDLEVQPVRGRVEPHRGRGAGAVPGHVGERLGHDAVRRHLDRGRQVRELLGRGHVDGHRVAVPVAQPDRLLAQRRHQAELVERRRPHRVDHPPDLLDRDHRVGAQLGHHLLGRGGVGADQVARRVGGEGDPGEPRAEAVVQLAAQPAPFLLDRRDRLAARLDQVLGQRPGAQRLGQQRDGQPEHLLVAGRERQVARAQPDHQLAGAVEVEGAGVGGLGAGRRQRYAVDQQRGVRDDQRLADRPQRHDRVRADPAGHRRRGAERVRPLAEEQLVDDAAEDDAGGVVGRGAQRGDEGLRAQR